jgi:YggT family protein
VVVLGTVFELLLWFYLVLLLARLVTDWIQMFARTWQPAGPMLVILELVYSATDPPLKLIRRIIPPLRFGGIALDLSILLVLVICYVLLNINRRFLPIW